MELTVLGVSDWSETDSDYFTIFYNRQFNSMEEAVAEARKCYNDDLTVVVRWINEEGEEQEQVFEPEEPKDGEEAGE